MCTAGERVSLTITGPGPSFFQYAGFTKIDFNQQLHLAFECNFSSARIYFATPKEKSWDLHISKSLSTASNILCKWSFLSARSTLSNLVEKYFETFIMNLKGNLEICMSSTAHKLCQASSWCSWRALRDVKTSKFIFLITKSMKILFRIITIHSK